MIKSIETMNIAEWHALFGSRTAILSNHIRNAAFVQAALAAIHQIKPGLAPERDRFFELHAHLHILLLLLHLAPNQALRPGAFIGFHTHTAISEVQLKIAGILKNKPETAEGTGDRQLLTETLSFLRKQMLIETGDKAYFSDSYFGLWHCWIGPDQPQSQLYLEELQHLKEAPGQLSSTLSRCPWLLAQAWMNFFLRRDQEALALLAEINSGFGLRGSDLFPLLAAMAEAGEWQRLLEWLAETAPLMERQKPNSLELFYGYWDGVIAHIPHAEQQMWGPLFRLSPSLYEQKLLMHGKWQQWMDYQLSTGTDPFAYRVGVFAPIEKHAPELLLPFYHQAAESYVLLKNRAGYKSAVKLLKRLAKLYKKRKDEERWETFIAAFASRHSRLRALQEELRKGKLIP